MEANRTLLVSVLTIVVGVATSDLGAQDPLPGPAELDSALAGLDWREIGPVNMGGRTVDIAGIPGEPDVVYMATASGGLWKTEDRAVTWRSVFESGGTLSLGAVAVAPSDPNVVYIGTGEHNPRNDASIGDGVYRSTDGGETWTHLGLERTERIARIRVHPRDPDVVWVAAMGHAWGANEERGVYRSRDGGASWQRVLYVDEDTGAADLDIDPSNPRILYAAMWDYRRRPWHFRSGGPGSGLYRSADGGDTWTRLTDPALDNGLPGGVLGRIGVAVADRDPDVVYAIIESHADHVLWRTDDAGRSWRPVTDNSRVGGRPFYYSDIRVDPTDANTVYAVSGALMKSVDGGREWTRLARNIHGDHQSLWIDPEDPDRLVNGNDGGFHFSFDGGDSWEFVNTVPISQFYQVGFDYREPYYVCGGRQDNDTMCGPAATWTVAGILKGDWYEIVGPGDGMYVQIDPGDPTRIFANTQGGSIARVDLETGEDRSIEPYPPGSGGQGAGAHPYRFNWNPPVLMSPHDPQTVFFGGNVLFRTTDDGQSWDAISPDLSRADSAKLGRSGGPITPDNSTAEYHATLYTLAQSPLDADVIWAGTDDGNVQVTRDGGATWTNVVDGGRAPAGACEDRRDDDVCDRLLEDEGAGNWISRIEASRTDPGAAFVAIDRHRMDDMAPHVFHVTDYGAAWTDITGDLPAVGYVHVVRQDPRNPGLLYAGTELGIFASWDGGDRWVPIRLGDMPKVAVRDIQVHPRDNDLIVATHGRSLWILDDLTPLQRLPAAFSYDEGGATMAARADRPAASGSGAQGAGPGSAGTRARLGSGADDGLQAAARAVHRAVGPALADAGIEIPVPGADAHGDAAHLFAPMPATRYVPWGKRFRFDLGDKLFVGENPPYGALVTYRLEENLPGAEADAGNAGGGAGDTAAAEGVAVDSGAAPGSGDAEGETATEADAAPGTGDEAARRDPRPDSVRFRVVDDAGRVIRAFKGPGTRGVHRVAWDLRHEGLPDPEADLDRDAFTARMQGPRALPGAYTIEMIAGADTLRVPAAVRLDPRLDVPHAELVAQRDAQLRIRRLAGRGATAVRGADAVREQLDALKRRLDDWVEAGAGDGGAVDAAGETAQIDRAATRDELSLAIDSLDAALGAVRNQLAPDAEARDAGAGRGIVSGLTGLAGDMQSATARPTAAQTEWLDRFAGELEDALRRYDRLIAEEVPALSRRIEAAGVPRVLVPGG